MAEKRKKGRWGKLGQDTKSRSWVKDEYPLTNELISEMVKDKLLDYDELKRRFIKNKYKALTTGQNLGRIARLSRDIERRKERMKNTDDLKYYKESKELIAKWKHEAKQRIWLINKIAKTIIYPNDGGLKYQRRKDKTGEYVRSEYINLRINWWGKKHTGTYIGTKSNLKKEYKELSPYEKRKFKDWKKFAIEKGKKKYFGKLGDRIFKSETALLQKKLYKERLLDQF